MIDGVPWSKGKWAKGVVEWLDGDTAYLSVVFSWDCDEAFARACWYRQAGYKVRVGGPGVFTAKRAAEFEGIAQVGGSIRDVQFRHNPMSTKASEGCPVDCWYCIVGPMEGTEFTLFPDFEPRPVLTDNNLSALPADYQQHVVDRYAAAGVPLLDANSGFEPKTFDEDVFNRWRPINKGPWRFGLDETQETADVERVIAMLKRNGVGARRIQVYVMIGHEPFEACMARVQRVLDWGGEPYVQPILKLTARHKDDLWIRHDWSYRQLKRVQRWVNGHVWRKTPFAEYRPSFKTSAGRNRQPDYLFAEAA